MEHEDSPAMSGQVHIATSGVLAATIYRWPITNAGYLSPGLDLYIKVRADGALFCRIDADPDRIELEDDES